MPIEKANIIKLFKERLGNPMNTKSLIKYAELVNKPTTKHSLSQYTELHHVFPISVFSDLKDIKSYQVPLAYEDHVKAHLLLATAYPIRKFIRPLNYMITDRKKNAELLSACTKEWWKKFKQTDKYNAWRMKRKTWLKAKYAKDKNHILQMTKKRFETPDAKKKISEHFKALWKDPEYRKRIRNSMKVAANTPDRIQIVRNWAKERWKNKEFRSKLSKKMAIINKDEKKRKAAGQAIKKLWQDPNFRAKALKRKKTFWWNNGKEEIKASECPLGYARGRLKGLPRKGSRKEKS